MGASRCVPCFLFRFQFDLDQLMQSTYMPRPGVDILQCVSSMCTSSGVQISIGLVLGAATAAGLTLGLMSLDLMNLEILQKSGTPAEQHHAARIIPLVKQHHLLLVCAAYVACSNQPPWPVWPFPLGHWCCIFITRNVRLPTPHNLALGQKPIGRHEPTHTWKAPCQIVAPHVGIPPNAGVAAAGQLMLQRGASHLPGRPDAPHHQHHRVRDGAPPVWGGHPPGEALLLPTTLLEQTSEKTSHIPPNRPPHSITLFTLSYPLS